MEDVSMFLFLETQEDSTLLQLSAWLPAALKCDQWETGSNVWLCLAIATDAVELELAKREKAMGYTD